MAKQKTIHKAPNGDDLILVKGSNCIKCYYTGKECPYNCVRTIFGIRTYFIYKLAF